MNLTQLKYFKAVGIYQSVSMAAEYLHISQPSLSSAIKDLEDEFGIQLFKRTHKGMILTNEGNELLERATKLLSHAEAVERVMQDMGNRKKSLHLGIPPMIGSLVLSKILGDFAVANPDITLDITEGGRSELLNLADDGLIDMLILPHYDSFDSRFNVLRIGQLETACCVSKKSPLSKLSTIQPSDLMHSPIVLFKNSFFQTELILNWFSKSNISPNIVIQSSQLSTIENLVASGNGAGFMFKELTKENQKIKAISLNNPLKLDVSLVWKKQSVVFSSMKRFYNYVKNTSLLAK
ncbi:MAG: LysR family transcriptional regulator [Ruminococcaceae bacterium]|nr:LysR family transcriptional regulator [Oscillospiraceae bacterium]